MPSGVAVGYLVGGPIGGPFGPKYVLWCSILGVLPFTLMLPHAGLFWTGPLSVVIGLILSSAFSAIVVYGQELMPGKVGLIAGLFFGFAFGMAGARAPRPGPPSPPPNIAFLSPACPLPPPLGP